METLRDTYDRVEPLLNGCESFAIAEAVESVRQFWKPPIVKVILLAESHVFTTDDEMCAALMAPFLSLIGVPQQFVRFVYCLGYGESQLLTRPVVGNKGTPQFWKLFNDCCNSPSSTSARQVFVSGNPNIAERLQAKIALLEQLRRQGIWLVDASITAIYRPGASRPDSNTVTTVLQRCWDSYIRSVIEREAAKHIVVVGKGVGASLESRLRASFPGMYTVLPQPQAHLLTTELALTRQTYFSVCQHYCGSEYPSPT